MMRKKLLVLLCIYLGTVSAWASTDKYRLSHWSDPATSIVIGWNQVDGENPKVYYGTEDHGTNWESYPQVVSPTRSVDFAGMQNRFVRLSELQPNTAYYFVIKDSNSSSARFWFKTAPNDPNERLSFIAGGDSRNNRGPRQNGNLLVGKLKPHAVLFGGDMTNACTDQEWKQWLDDWQLTISEDGRMYPIVPARGNHESNDGYIYHLFDTPRNNESVYYALTFGGGLLRAYTLNTEIAIPGDQSDWLTEDLAASTEVRWKLAQYHKPIRPHVKDKGEGNNQYTHWASAFYDHNVKLVVECDAHTVKTTWPIRPGTEDGADEGFVRDDDKGTTYVGEGCWGAPLRSNNDNKTWTRNSGKFNQFKWIFVDQSKIEVRTIQLENAPFVKANPNDDPFAIPANLMVWSPSNGKVVSIYHQEVTPPEVSLTAPTNGAMVAANAEITLKATATDGDGRVVKVAYYANENLIGEDLEAPFEINHTPTQSGDVALYALAVDDEGNSTRSAEVTVAVGVTTFIDDCETTDGWEPAENIRLSTESLEGSDALEFSGSADVEFSRAFIEPYSSLANPAFARLEFRYYISDASVLGDENQVELGSGGTSDKDEFNWSLGALKDGWNLISLDFSNANVTGTPDLSAINWFRLYNIKNGKEVTSRIDGIRIVDPSADYSVRDFSDLDRGSLFHFALMSDNKGDSPYQASSSKRKVSMQRLNAWVKNAEFVIGAGDHLVSTAEDDPFLEFIKHDPYWRARFYPNIADGENQAFGKDQGKWGTGWELFNYVDNFWDRPNVEMQPNKVDYYAHFEHSGFKVHLIQLHFSDRPTDGKLSFKEESRQFMQDKLEALAKTKTDKDIIVVVAHSINGDFVKDAEFNEYRKDLLLKTADVCISATIHTFERYTDYNIAYPEGAVHYNSGAACHTGSTHGYMEFHVLDNPPRLVIQYVNLEDYSSRRLQTGYIDGIGDPTLALVKELGGPAYNADWKNLQLTQDECPDNPNKLVPGTCGCAVPEGTCQPHALVVMGGDGDGSYAFDEKVEIIADPAPEGFEFDFWGTLQGFPEFENVNAATTQITMGTAAVQVKANYKPLVNDAAFVAQTVPDTLTAGQTYTITLSMQNSGGLSWFPGKYALRFRFLDTRDVWGLNEIALAKDVAPGEQADFTFQLVAPEMPGTYEFQWKMQVEGTEFFGESTQFKKLVVEELILASMPDGPSFSVFPNPTDSDWVQVTFDTQPDSETSITVYSLTGALQKVYSLLPENGKMSYDIELRGVKAGVYMLALDDGTHRYSRRLVVR